MKVSIVTTCYNSEEYIEETIQSVLNQTYTDIEYIIVDGNSTDSTLDIVHQYKDKIFKIISEPDNGMYDGINKGLKLATGDVCAYLNADDLYFTDTVEKVVHYFKKAPATQWLYGGFTIINEKGNHLLKTNGFKITRNEFFNFNNSKICQPSTFWTRELLQEENYFDLKFKYASDFDLLSKSILKYKYSTIKDPLSQFRVHEESISQSLNDKLKMEAKQIYERNKTRKKILPRISYYLKYFIANPHQIFPFIKNGLKNPVFS